MNKDKLRRILNKFLFWISVLSNIMEYFLILFNTYGFVMHILCLENDTKRYKCICFLRSMNHVLEYFCIVLNNLLHRSIISL